MAELAALAVRVELAALAEGRPLYAAVLGGVTFW